MDGLSLPTHFKIMRENRRSMCCFSPQRPIVCSSLFVFSLTLSDHVLISIIITSLDWFLYFSLYPFCPECAMLVLNSPTPFSVCNFNCLFLTLYIMGLFFLHFP